MDVRYTGPLWNPFRVRGLDGITALLLVGVLPENGVLRDPATGGVLHSPFLKGIVVFIFLGMSACGIAYGGGVPDTLLESELFGYEKGAFTGALQRKAGLVEASRGGALFLDEVENLSLEIQMKLLRLLDERKFRRLGSAKERTADFQLISASNRAITELVQTGAFREDLYYRMVGLRIMIPPLRERRDDILPLANAFLEQHQYGKKLKLTEKAANLILEYPWPGNLRELRTAMQVAALNATGKTILPEDFSLTLQNPHIPDEEQSLAAAERRHIAGILKQNSNNRAKTAKILKITETTLRNKIKKYGL